ncbi:MAG: hypothetical protein FJZ49_07015 [Candidatus Verstraetearchaeota archaeon]|nr:hypothetical protein [Candidatus Verstraetearchaeota archaeon]
MEVGNDFVSLVDLLGKMEEEKKVDVSIVGVLDKLIANCKSDERFWAEREDMPVDESFLLYHSVRNSRLILQKMKTQFISAEKNHENPIVIDHAIEVAPLLSELFQSICSLKEQAITPQKISFISNKLKALRNMANRFGMLPSPKEELTEINKEKLERSFSRFADTVRAMFVEV